MNDNTLLFRQVAPDWINNERVSSQAFRPFPKDKGKLSVDNGDRISAKESWLTYTQSSSSESVGVMAVTVEECKANCTSVVSDPTPTRPAHTLVDFDDKSRRQIKRVSEKLRDSAVDRGWQYRP